MFSNYKKLTTMVQGIYQETALLTGISDVMVVKWKDNTLHSSAFVVCFGTHSFFKKGKNLSIYVN